MGSIAWGGCFSDRAIRSSGIGTCDAGREDCGDAAPDDGDGATPGGGRGGRGGAGEGAMPVSGKSGAGSGGMPSAGRGGAGPEGAAAGGGSGGSGGDGAAGGGGGAGGARAAIGGSGGAGSGGAGTGEAGGDAGMGGAGAAGGGSGGAGMGGAGMGGAGTGGISGTGGQGGAGSGGGSGTGGASGRGGAAADGGRGGTGGCHAMTRVRDIRDLEMRPSDAWLAATEMRTGEAVAVSQYVCVGTHGPGKGIFEHGCYAAGSSGPVIEQSNIFVLTAAENCLAWEAQTSVQTVPASALRLDGTPVCRVSVANVQTDNPSVRSTGMHVGQVWVSADRAVCSYELYESAEIAHEYEILMVTQ